MAFGTDPRVANMGGRVAVDQVDVGLRRYMLSIYNYMGLGLALTGIVALLVASSPALYEPILFSPLKWVVMLAPLGFVMFLGFRVQQMSTSAVQTTFWAFCAVMGLSMASIFLVFTGASIARTFFVTAAAFGALSLYGYTTKRDLSAFGTFLIVGLFGLVIASLVNIFIGSSAIQFAVSVAGVLIFAGLTAWDTQRLKEMYFEAMEPGAQTKMAVMGALSLYLNFINMFQFLLQFMGVRTSNE
jgi:FtsH-binding integral membrane protein